VQEELGGGLVEHFLDVGPGGKAFSPLPVRTAQRWLSSASKASKAAISSSSTWLLSALSALGRLSVMIVTAP
jgi:hypothetical protein